MITAKKAARSVSRKSIDTAAVSSKKRSVAKTASRSKVLRAKPVAARGSRIQIANKTVANSNAKLSKPAKKIHKNKNTSRTDASAQSAKSFIVSPLSKPKIKLAQVRSLVLFNPNQFMLDQHALAVGVARYGGLFFVVMGAIFTLFFAQLSFSTHSLLAEVISSGTMTTSGGTSDTSEAANTSGSSDTSGTTGSGTSSTGTIDCTNVLQYGSTLCASTVNHTPAATFDVDASGSLIGSVRVRVNVQYAQSVSLSAYNTIQHQEYRIGTLSDNSNGTWQTYWNTPSFPDGTYVLKALIGNAYGSYEQVDPASIVVANNPLSTTVSTLNATSTQASSSSTNTTTSGGPTALSDSTANSTQTTNATTTTTIAQTTPISTGVVLSADSLTGSSQFAFSISTQQAQSINIYALQKSQNKTVLLGYAYHDSGTMWKYKWLTSGFPDGDYSITAQVLLNGQQLLSNPVVVTKKSTTATATTTTIVAANTTLLQPTTTAPAIIAPAIKVSLQDGSTQSGIATVKISVQGAQSVQVYAQKRYSLIRTYLGAASLVDTNVWLYRWDTTQSPNAQYALVAVVKNSYGSYEGQSDFVTVQNATAIDMTPTQQDQVKKLTAVSSDVRNAIASSSATSTTLSSGTQVISTDQKLVDTELATHNDVLQNDLQLLATAMRTNNQTQIQIAQAALQKSKELIIQSSPDLKQSDTAVSLLNDKIASEIDKVSKNVEITNKLIAERTGTKASLDSDHDGISDYDEINIYHTNPFIADTDGDGFTDGAEILSGNDPLNPRSQSLVAYESPKNAGIVRDDILKVNSIATAVPDKTKEASSTPVALISGKALPDSFVTLYIFSDPIIVTVKTDADGNWNYRFDKELDNGKHQVYVGMTDNAGNIIAKSQPFAFIKEAQAYAPENTTDINAPAPAASSEKPLFSGYIIYLVVSLSVVAIGLVLIMLGLHLDEEGRKKIVLPEQADAVT